MQSLVVRAANRKSVGEITQEIRAAQAGGAARYRPTMTFLTLPAALRFLAWRVVLGNPFWCKRSGGTVGMSAVGMFGAGGGWGIPIAPSTLMVTVGGIAGKPRYVAGELCKRQLLSPTLSFDHAIVDGTTAARFARRLTDLVQAANGPPPEPSATATAVGVRFHHTGRSG